MWCLSKLLNIEKSPSSDESVYYLPGHCDAGSFGGDIDAFGPDSGGLVQWPWEFRRRRELSWLLFPLWNPFEGVR